MALFGNLFGSSQPATPPTQSSTFVPSAEQKKLFDLALPMAEQFGSTPIQRYGGNTVVGFDPAQTQGQNLALGAVGDQTSLARSGVDATNFWLNPDRMDVANDPTVRNAIQASINPITDQLLRSALPRLRSGSIAGGTFGGSRGDLAEGLATGEAARAAGDTASKVALSARGQNIDAQGRALGLLPQTQQTTLAPATTTSGVGDVRQGQAQRERTAEVDAFNFDQFAPLLQARELIGLGTALPGGTNIATGSVAPEPSTLSKVFGGAATGASLGSAFGPIGTGIGALGGAALPFLFD